MRKRSYSLSQGGVSLAGVVLVLFSVSSGLGVSCKIGIKFNPASLQVSILELKNLMHCYKQL